MKSSRTLVNAIDSLLKEAGIPGCSLAVVNRDGVVWSHAFGFADLGRRQQAETATVYHLFSGTKLFTATAVLQLVEQGRLDLDASAKTYLADLPQLSGISLRALLTHTSGLKETLKGFLAVRFPGEGLPTTAQALAGYKLTARRAPERKVQYRNVNYAILGEVISRVSGIPYREYIRNQVLKPLSSDADFEVSGFDQERLATGYLNRWDPSRLLLRFVFPSVARRLYRGQPERGLVALQHYNLSCSSIGGLIGSVDSFAPFLQSQLSGGSPLLSEAATGRMQALTFEGAAGIASKTGVGLGWKIGVVDGCRFLNHEGSGAGFTSELRLYPEESIGIVVLMNQSSMSKTMRVVHQLCELIRRNRHEK